jgi:hypothetical protein
MIPIVEFFKTVKGISIAIGILAVLVFLIFRQINKSIGDAENELIEIENVDNPTPTEFDRLCLSVWGEQCPKLSQ